MHECRSSLNRPTSAPMPFYGGDYRPDDEPPSEAVLEEKRILEHQFRRPSPSRLSSTSSSIRPPTAVRQGGGISANRSLRARPSGSSPRRSLQRSSAFGNRRSTTITDRGRTASMPAVPIVRVRPDKAFPEYLLLLLLFIYILFIMVYGCSSSEQSLYWIGSFKVWMLVKNYYLNDRHIFRKVFCRGLWSMKLQISRRLWFKNQEWIDGLRIIKD